MLGAMHRTNSFGYINGAIYRTLLRLQAGQADLLRRGDSRRRPEEAGLGAYSNRWEAWQSCLNGAAVHTYRHFGVHMEKWHKRGSIGPWPENLSAPGPTYAGLAAEFLRKSEWWKPKPAREWIRVNGKVPPYPRESTRAELNKAIRMAAEPGRTYVLYVPMSNPGKTITITKLPENRYLARWFNPKNGSFHEISNGKPVNIKASDGWTIPNRPDNEDWVLVLQAKQASLTVLIRLKNRERTFTLPANFLSH
jgi:hypothetical protein